MAQRRRTWSCAGGASEKEAKLLAFCRQTTDLCCGQQSPVSLSQAGLRGRPPSTGTLPQWVVSIKMGHRKQCTQMKRLLFFALLAALFTTGSAMAQTLYVHGGTALPSSTAFNDAYKAGVNTGIGIGIPITSNLESVNLEGVVMGRFDRFQEESGIAGGEFSSYSATGNLKLNGPMMSSRISPYALAGAGLFRLGVENNFESEFGLQFGAGLSMRTSPRFRLMIEPNYVVVLHEGENTEFFPIRVGASLKM